MAWLPFAKLEITDGTTTIGLLNMQKSGFCITGWEPAIQDLKAGGTWADPPTSDERELIVSQLANVEETYTFDVSAASPDELIGKLRDLRALLEKGRQYVPTEWQDTPVDLVAQGYGDTNVRYARVKNWRTPADGFPYGPPMWDTIEGTAIEDFQIVIERGAWQANRSGVGTETEASVIATYDGRTVGNVDSTGTRDPTADQEVFSGNRQGVANLTDIYIDDGGVFSANLMDAALPFALLPAVPAVNDHLYIGIDTALADSGPFESAIFDIGTAGAGYSLSTEYYNGAWVALTSRDATGDLKVPGVNGIFWSAPSDWITVAINGITAYWIRLTVFAAPGPFTTPTQQNRDIYTANWAFDEIQSDAIGGDIPPLIEIETYNESGGAIGGGTGTHLNKIIVGLRSVSRGDNFRAYLNLASIANDQNPTGVTLAYGASTSSAIDPTATSGFRAVYNPAGIEAMADRVTISMSSAIASEYMGIFHAYVRATRTGGSAGDILVRLSYSSPHVPEKTTESVSVPTTNVFEVLDLGAISLPTSGLVSSSETLAILTINIQAESTNGTPPDLYLYDLILIPVDEWIGNFEDLNKTDASTVSANFLSIDSVEYPKVTIRALVLNSSLVVQSSWLTTANGGATAQANARQRYWTLSLGAVSSGTGAPFNSLPGITNSILINRNQRYWSMRGAG